MGAVKLAAVVLLSGCCGYAAQPDSREFYNAIRNNDLARLRALAATKAAANTEDDRGTTPLMVAAVVGSADAVKLLLNAGADVNARNGLDVTALIYGAMDATKVRLLVDAGADVNARSRAGRTPLIVAAGRPGSVETVRLLLAKGAKSKVEDASGTTPLTQAARANEIESLRLLLAHPVDIDAGDAFGFTALLWAAGHGNLPAVKLLLEKKADVNATWSRELPVRNGLVAVSQMTPLMMAPLTTPDVVRTLLAAGAKVNARDVRGMTPLMLAVAADEADPAVIRMLLDAGADREIRGGTGETARDWAAKFNHPEVTRIFGVSPAPVQPAVQPVAGKLVNARMAVERSLGLLQSTSTEYFKQSGCVGCHHQPLTGLAIEAGAKNGIPVDEGARAEQLRFVKTELMSSRDLALQGIFISTDFHGYALFYLAEVGAPADATTDAYISLLAAQQHRDGSWRGMPLMRPPLEHSNWVRTALAVGALARYPIPARRAEFTQRIAAARRWLAESEPAAFYEQPYRLLGLKWAGAPGAEIERIAATVRRQQRADGSWAQVEQLPSDAFATGLALYALRQTGMPPQDPVYRRGVAYLLSTQLPDGSWLVHSRAPKVQPYFQSGFPHDHDQWISTAATALAAAALAEAVEPVQHTAEAR